MKAFFTTLLAIACAVILIWGNIHWNQKSVVSGANEQVESKNAKSSKPVRTIKEESKEKEIDLTVFTQNWPEEAKASFQEASDNDRPFKIAIVGSAAIGDEPDGWAYQVKEELEKALGSEVVAVTINRVNSTTVGYINEDEHIKLAEEKVDLILLEPFILSDNGNVLIEDSLDNIGTIIEAITENNSNATFILQPPNPIYKPKLYATQVEALEAYAKENNITYLNHWDAWPDTQSEDIYEYVEDDTGLPNEEGHKLWSQYVMDYLISK